jgi:ADP-ribose pyrophosphatase
MKPQEWDEISRGEPDKRKIFTVRSDVVRSRNTGTQYTVDRLECANWVNVVAFTENDELVLVKQWRFGARAFTLELPAGLIEDGERALDAGLRELVEETGYAPVDVRKTHASLGVDIPQQLEPRVIGECMPNPAFMNNVCTTIFAPRVTLVKDQKLDPMEEIETVLLPARDIDGVLKRGEMGTALGIVGLHWWRLASR